MVMVLIQDGNAKAAIELEKLWNTVTQGRPFLTLCGYPTSCFHGGASDLASGARREHWALSYAGEV